MPDIIKDGTGRGFQARVSSDNFLETSGGVESVYASVSRKP
jgi:hypothetical protein